MNEVSTGNQIVSSSDVLSSGIASADHLTPDGMLLYLQTRLTGIDDQINAAFEKQQQIEQIRKVLGKLQNASSGLSTEKGSELSQAEKNAFNAAMEELRIIDEGLWNKLVEEFETVGLGRLTTEGRDDGRETTFAVRVNEYDPAKTNSMSQILGSSMKQLESSAQLEMIQLQSMMSARQAAIQLATNLVSAIGKSTETIVANIGR